MKSKKEIISISDYLNEMSKAVKQLDDMPHEKAKNLSVRSLQASGVLTKNGSVKRIICKVNG